MPRVHIVTTGGPDDGQGHVSRAVAMAEGLIAAGAVVTVEMLRGNLTEAQGSRLESLGVGSEAPSDPEVVLVDLPDPNVIRDRWPAERLAVFDDREWYEGSAALLIQPSLPRWGGRAAADRVLEGYAFVPIRASLRRLAQDAVATSAEPNSAEQNVVVCFGGSDPVDVTGRIGSTLAGRRTWRTTIVIGPGYRGDVSEGDSTGAAVLRDPPDLDERLARATVVVGGAGTMKFELALLGRPTILVAVVDDQLPIGPPFAATGAAAYLGDGRVIDPASIGEAVERLIADPDARSRMTDAGRRLIDGRGAARIAAELESLAGR